MRSLKSLLVIVVLAAAPNLKGGPTATTKTQCVYNAYWTTADGYTSLAELHNNLISARLGVTPILLLQDGTRISLAPVDLPPLGNATVDIGSQLAKKGLGAGLQGSAMFQYSSPSAGGLIAETYVENRSESIAYTMTNIEKPATSPVQHALSGCHPRKPSFM